MNRKMYKPVEILNIITQKITKEMKLAFFSVIISGLIAHGSFIFNNYYSFDAAASLFDITGTYNHGRWFFWVLVQISQVFFTNIYSALPIICATITLGGIAVSAAMIVYLFNMKNYILIVIAGCIFSVFPVICAEFGYVGYPQYYFFAMVFTVLGVLLTVKYKYGMIPACILLMLGLGIYQAFFPIAVLLFLAVIIFDLIDNRDVKEIWIKAIKYMVTLGIGMILYFIVNKLFLYIMHASLTGYQGIDSMGHVSIKQILQGIMNAYMSFIDFLMKDFMGLSSSIVVRASLLLIVIMTIIILGIFLIYQIKNRQAKCLFFIAILLLPLAINIIYVMCCNEGAFVYSLMLYTLVFTFVFPLIVLDRYEQLFINQRRNNFGILLQWVAILLNVIIIFYYIGYDNVLYSKADMIQKQTDTYCTTLVTQIKSVDGYSDEYPIILVQNKEKEGRFDFNDASMLEVAEYSNISLNPYGGTMNNWIRDYSFEYYFKYRTGFATKLDKDISSIENFDLVEQMPCYPKSGSIKVIDEKIVVKLSDY